MRTINWIAPTYHCGNCLMKIKRVLAEIDGVRLVSSDQGRQRLDPRRLTGIPKAGAAIQTGSRRAKIATRQTKLTYGQTNPCLY